VPLATHEYFPRRNFPNPNENAPWSIPPFLARCGPDSGSAPFIWRSPSISFGHFLTPLFLIPMTWLQDAVNAKKG
jgi:hypothetical protein